ncbi:MAG: energy transducer TonB [Pseudomonadota bacterium]
MMALLGTSSAAAMLSLEPTSKWTLREYEDKCRLKRTFGVGEDSVTLWLDQGGEQQAFNLTLLGEPFANPYGPGIRIKPGEEDEIIRSYISVKSSKGRPVLRMYGLTLVQPEMKRGKDLAEVNVRLGKERVAAVTSLKVSGAGLKGVTLALGPMGEQFERLQTCGTRLEGLLSEAGRALTGEASPPEPLEPGSWLKSEDWPRYLLRARMEGQLEVRLTVNTKGRASGCTVLSSNRPQLFDDAVCLNLIQRARFKPAVNAQKEPVASYYQTSIAFQIK